jgi:hypothetical protein
MCNRCRLYSRIYPEVAAQKVFEHRIERLSKVSIGKEEARAENEGEAVIK